MQPGKQRAEQNPVREGVQPLSRRDVAANPEIAEQKREAILDGEPPGTLDDPAHTPVPEVVGDESGGNVAAGSAARAQKVQARQKPPEPARNTAEPPPY